MDRRPRDIPPEDRYGGGQSYRPGNVRNRTPPRRDRDDNFRDRSPPRRGPDNRGPPRRSRSPIGREPFRRRSPSPRFGVPRGGDSYRARSRTPPRRDDFRERRFDDRFRGPRSPNNGDRSPVSARGRRTPPRRFSPRRFDDYGGRPRSPPRRGFSPRNSDRGYDSRPRSPVSRIEMVDRTADVLRRQSPSSDHRQDDRGRESIATSRRSSPPLHASRAALIQDEQRSGRPSPRSDRPPSPRRPSPPRDNQGDVVMADRQPPSGPRDAGPRDIVPPSGPRAVPPAGPREPAGRGGFAARGRGAYSVDFRARGPPVQTDRPPAPVGRGSSYEREPFSPAATRPYNAPRPGVSRAPSTLSTSGKYDEPPREPRSAAPGLYRRPTEPPSGPAGDRRSGVHPALRDLPEIVTNGRKIPPPVDQTRMNRLEEDAEKLRKIVYEKDVKKRKSLREWDRLVRESESAAFRSEIAEESVRAYELEAEGTGLAF